ncbi:hypothetical protein [Flavobacterium lacustre]|uniref:hypothetical protein n=1 Tax=Flavobacterium lacustre TaxID=3016339 RepID=UPI0022B625C6|nr:hypothetical protein [Flavobacterium lacustre]
MKKELTREQMIALIASDYGYGKETTEKLKTEILRDVYNSSQSHLYLKNLLAFGTSDIYLED